MIGGQQSDFTTLSLFYFRNGGQTACAGKRRDYLREYLRFSKFSCAVSIRYFEAVEVFCIITRMATSPKKKILSLEQRVDVLKCGCGKSQIARTRSERNALPLAKQKMITDIFTSK